MNEILHETYNAVETRELLRTNGGDLRVTVGDSVSLGDRERIWDMLQKGFVSLNNRSGTKQDMTREEYDHDIDSPTAKKYVAYNDAKEPVGFLNVHLGLADISWAPDFVKEKMERLQHELNPTAAPAYVGTLVVPEELRGGDIAAALIRASYIHWQENIEEKGDVLCFFDCAEPNNPGIPKLLKWLSRPAGGFSGIPMTINELAVIKEGDKLADATVVQAETKANAQHYFVMQRLNQ